MESTSTEKSKRIKPDINEDTESFYKVYSIFSYFIVLVVIGVSMWWYTTRVYRADLPLNDMYALDIPDTTTKQLGIPLSLEYDILITIVNPKPDKLKIHLEGQDIDLSLQSFLEKLFQLAEFTVKSQWLYLVELGAQPRLIKDHYALYQEQLPHVITPLEKRLWAHLSPRPCLNLILYVSRCDVPLYIYNDRNEKSDSNAFISPGWGGIYIVNPDNTSCANGNFKPDIEELLPVFSSQILKLLDVNSVEAADILNLHQRTAKEMIISSKRTLKSLAQLLGEISSIVISDEVAEKIVEALENVHLAEAFLEKNEVESALKYAKIAYNNSEKAFGDPSLLALLYFPEDQKYAVYIPLFLPVMIPVFMSLITFQKLYSKSKENKIRKE